jgi:hypothetical protein
MPKFDFDIEAIVLLIVGSALGTLIKSVTRPEPKLGRWAVQVVVAMTVGVVLGGAIIEYLELGGMMAACVAAGCALISEEIVKGVQARGRRVAKGDFSIAPEADNDD